MLKTMGARFDGFNKLLRGMRGGLRGTNSRLRRIVNGQAHTVRQGLHRMRRLPRRRDQGVLPVRRSKRLFSWSRGG